MYVQEIVPVDPQRRAPFSRLKSRSPALAYAVQAQHWGAGSEIEAYLAMRSICPKARPNSLIVLLADKVLVRKGAMIAASLV